MPSIANLEQHILQNLRQLTPEKQQEVLNFTESLRQTSEHQNLKSKLSLKEIAAMPLSQRHEIISQYISNTAEDFMTDLELTEFSVLDVEGWEEEHDYLQITLNQAITTNLLPSYSI